MTSDFHDRPLRIRQPRPFTFLLAALVYLAAALTAFVLVDVLDVGGARSWFVERVPHTGSLWIHLFGESSPTEMFQWALLAYLVVVSGIMGGYLARGEQHRAASFWKLVSIGAALILLEDAGSVRHRLAEYATIGLQLPRDSQIVHLVITPAWLGLIGGVFCWAIIAHGHSVWSERRFRLYGLAGVAAYALAAAGHVSSAIVGWYPAAGALLEERVLRTSLHVPAIWTQEQLHYYLIDFPIEESLELLGAACLAAAAVSYLQSGIKARSHAELL